MRGVQVCGVRRAAKLCSAEQILDGNEVRAVAEVLEYVLPPAKR
jgi:hypothetical protein